MLSPTRTRRLRAVGASLAAAALVATTAMTSLADEKDGHLGDAADFGVAGPATPSIEEQLAAYGDAVMPNRWFVEFDGGASKLVGDAKSAGIDVNVVSTYSKGWNGASVVVDDGKIHDVAKLKGVRGVFPVLHVEKPARVDDNASPDVDHARTMTGADVANEELGFTGKGIKVGIIDSGIDYNHPDLGGSGVNDQTKDFPNSRVKWGYDFTGDAYDASSDDPAVNTPKPDQYPDDCGGHGTHVAGIVGAKGEVTGVAPDVDFGAYRVFGCDGSSSSDVIMAAMEMAAKDGMDVINMSLGASYATWPSYPTAVMADKLVEDGIAVVVSQGNNGTGGVFSGGAPAVAHNVISVGSVDNLQFMAYYMKTAGGLEFPFFHASGSPEFEPGASFDVVAADAVTACEPDDVPQASGDGQALFVKRGTCPFHLKAWHGQQKGYDAVIIGNNVPGVINATVEDPARPDDKITIPVATTLLADGDALLAEIGDGSTTLSISEDQRRWENPTGGYQSDFSSYGLAADLTLKPDVSAPGGAIYSTYPLEEGAYASLGGTSMAAPHVAGAVALLLQAKPSLDPFQVRTALTNTADPFAWSIAPTYLEPVHRQGGGLIDIPQAITTTVSVEASKLSLGDSDDGPFSTTLTVRNSSNEAKTFKIGVEHGVATAGPSNNPGFYGFEADVTFSGDTVTVPANSTATFDVTISEEFMMDINPDPKKDPIMVRAHGAIYGGWITLTSETERLVVPFAGMAGDYQALTALTQALLVGVNADEQLYIAEPFHEFSMVGLDKPHIYFNLAYPVSGLYFDIYYANPDGTKGKKAHNNFTNYVTYLDQGRLGNATAIAWDGTYQGNKGNDKKRRAANGDYVIEVRVLKALGDPNNPDHWETWTSPAFTIKYGEGADTSAGNGPEPGKGNPGKGKGKDKTNPGKGKGKTKP